ncbi:MAG: DUF2779 domain-containing protein [Candidatus Accumulibacter sp.]|jgi:hypothetical protein|nr:DUF2779 domain-containing protein [Accumulibacter sp.]
MNKPLSKSRLLDYRQCPKRLWLQIHSPELRADSVATLNAFANGNDVGEIARKIYDPDGKGVEIKRDDGGFEAVFSRSLELLQGNKPIFEAGFRAEGALAFADVMLPEKKAGRRVWRMIEVKSSTEVKDYHRDDAAIQAFIARAAGVPLAGIALTHVDSKWVYQGDDDYRGLLTEEDLTEQAFARADEVRGWIAEAQKIAAKRKAPAVCTGKHCGEPNPCGFLAHCESQEETAEHPIQWLPNARKKDLIAFIEANWHADMREAPDELLNEQQRIVKKATLSGKARFDREGAARALAGHKLPAYFMDFETAQLAVPRWKGMKPYQQIPFQFSVHRLSRAGRLEHRQFIDLTGKDPSKRFAEALIAACGERGPIFVYNEAFEKTRIKELAERCPRLAKPLQAIGARVVDLLPVAREHYYHPGQHGSWSIKKVLPALCPDLDYDNLSAGRGEGDKAVQDGGMAMDAWREATAPGVAPARKAEIERQLLEYCKLDTFATVKLWAEFTGNEVNEQSE